MYTTIIRRIVRAGFRALSAGDYEQLLRRFHPQVIFSFAGPAPLGGEHRGVEAVREWFQRMFSYFPGNGNGIISRDSRNAAEWTGQRV